MESIFVEREIGGRTLRLETGKLAKQAAGAVVVQYGETVILTAVASADPRPGQDFFPLTVDYRERTYAAGKFPGGFKKREGAPSTKEILTMRLTDRPIRPLFPEGFIDEVQIMTTVLAYDNENDPDILSLIGASAALCVSDLPFLGPIGAVRVGRMGDELIALPTAAQQTEGDMDVVVAGHSEEINMIEGFAKEVPEEEMVDALLFAHEQIKIIIDMQRELREKVGKAPVVAPAPPDTTLVDQISSRYLEEIKSAKLIPGKMAKAEAVDAIRTRINQEFVKPSDEDPAKTNETAVKTAIGEVEYKAVRELILSGQRTDGRPVDEIRPLYSEVGVLARTHGSALFQRGETQCLMVVTLGGGSDEQRVEGLSEPTTDKFMLHYNFPPFSVGECRPIRGPGRREIGHGALAERSLKPVIPPPDKFPYTIRLVSEILESNGSSSMATVCAGTLSLMDAGVKISNPVAGISIGLVRESDRYTLLTDIIGDEDHFGDMDFKVAGSQRGITGIQLDLKIKGISEEIIRDTLARAREARINILKHMLKTLQRPKKDLSPYAPRVVLIKIDKEKIGAVIGPGGKMIRALQEDTKTDISIAEDGTITICGKDQAGAEDCRNRIEAMTEDIQVGRVYKGKVASITDFGAFVELVPGRDGLVHISELDHGYVSKVGDVCAVGDPMEVIVLAIDDHDRVKLSRKALLERDPNAPPPEPREPQPRKERDRDGGGGERGSGDRGARDRGGNRGGSGGRDRERSGGDRGDRGRREEGRSEGRGRERTDRGDRGERDRDGGRERYENRDQGDAEDRYQDRGDRDRDRDRDDRGQRDRSGGRGRYPSRDRDNDRGRDQGRDQGRDRDGGRGDRGRDGGRDGGREGGRDGGRDRDRDRGRDRDDY